MRIIKKILPVAVASIGAFAVAQYTHPFQLKSPFTKQVFRELAKYDYSYCEQLFKFMVKFQLLKNSDPQFLQNKIIRAGFDHNAQLLAGLKLIGLSGVQIGPVADKQQNLLKSYGAMYVKANINQFLDKQQSDRNKRINNFKIGVSLIPSSEVFELIPHLIPKNLTKAMNQLTYLYQEDARGMNNETKTKQVAEKNQVKVEQTLVDFVTIDTDAIYSKLDPEIAASFHKMMDNFINQTVINVGHKTRTAIYQVKQSKHKAVYLPALDKSGLQTYPANYQFITAKQIIEKLIAVQIQKPESKQNP